MKRKHLTRHHSQAFAVCVRWRVLVPGGRRGGWWVNSNGVALARGEHTRFCLVGNARVRISIDSLRFCRKPCTVCAAGRYPLRGDYGPTSRAECFSAVMRLSAVGMGACLVSGASGAGRALLCGPRALSPSTPAPAGPPPSMLRRRRDFLLPAHALRRWGSCIARRGRGACGWVEGG